VKQGVQLILERVQRHRAFPRLAAANGQNLQATLSPANLPKPGILRLEQPRFVPVLAEPLTQNVSSLENTVSQLELRNAINAVAEDNSLEVEAAFQTAANETTQVDEQFAAQISQQIFDQTLALETSGRSEGTEIVEPKTSSENLASEMPSESQSAPNANLPRVAQAPEIPNNRPINQAKTPEDSGVETRALQTKQPINQPPPPGTSQPRETLSPVANSRQEASRVDTVQAKISTPPLSFNLEQDISFSEPNQNEDTESPTREIPVSLVNPLLETPNLSPTENTLTVNASQDSQLESSTPIETAAQPVRSPSRLESTLEALRQFNPQTQNNESIVGLESAQPNARATKTSNVAPPEAASKVQPSSQKPLQPNPTKSQVQAENQDKPEPKMASSTKPQVEEGNQNPSSIQATLESPVVTRVTTGLPTETANTRENGIELVQIQNSKTQNAEIELAQVEVDSLASEPSGLEEQINSSDPNQNKSATLQTTLVETSQPETSWMTETQVQLPQVNSTKPELNRQTSSFETPNNQRPNEEILGDRQTSSESSALVVSPTTQAPLSEEARERAAYQRSVLMRAERAKRALAAKEELERDPTLELETNEAPAIRSSEAPQVAAPEVIPPLEPPPQTKLMPSLEAMLENPKPQTQNPQTSALSQTATRDLNVAVESNLNQQLANNLETTKPIAQGLEPVKSSEVQSENPRELQSVHSSASELPNSSEHPVSDLNQAASEVQAPQPIETQTSDLNQSLLGNSDDTQSNQGSSQSQNPNLAQVPNRTPDSSQTALPSSSQAATPNQDLPASFLNNSQGVSVYNPQRRIQRAAPTPPPPKPKPEPNEAEKLFADSQGMSEQDVLNVIRKAQGLPPIPTTTRVQNPVQGNIPTAQNAQTTNNLSQETLRPTEQAVELNDQSLITDALSQNTQDARVEQASSEATVQNVNTSGLNLNNTPNSETVPSHFDSNRSVQVSQTPSLNREPAKQNAVDANGNKIHVFNPPNRRVLPPRPKVEPTKTEAQKLFDAMEVTETADELFQRVVKNRLKPNANTEPEAHVQDSSLDFENTPSRVEASTPSSDQTLSPNLPNRNPQTLGNQQPSVSFTGIERVQLSQTATRFLKPIVGIDPNDVKIYRDPQTQRLTKAARADALTLGDTVLLSSEQPLESPETLGLIAHELTHVARNRQARFVPPVARGNNNLAAAAQSGNEEGLALGVEALARQGWNNFNQNTSTQNPRSPTTSGDVDSNRSNYGGLPAPADLPKWFIEDRPSPQAASQPAPRASNVAGSAPSENSFVQQAPTNSMAASMGAQAASEGRDVPTPPPAAGPLPQSATPKPEPLANRAAPDLDAMARQVYTILKRRLANERHRM
jgi:Domain of unknown function (DUF4157)